MFTFSERFQRELWGEEVVRKNFTEEREFRNAVKALGMFVGIPFEGNGFDETLAGDLEQYDVYSSEPLEKVCKIEPFFEKLSKICSASIDKAKYGWYYDNINRLDSLPNDEKIKLYGETVWTYLSQCGSHYDEIESYIWEKIDYRKFAQERLDELKEQDVVYLNKYYIELDWSGEYIKRRGDHSGSSIKGYAVKYIGEAGAGKTTQMRKAYYDSLNRVLNGISNKLPIWIALDEVNDSIDYDIDAKIKESLGDYAEVYSRLLKSGTIELYLDGYNELLTGENDQLGEKKKRMAIRIEEIYDENRDIVIYITDRTNESSVDCLSSDVSVYTCVGMTESIIEQYCNKKGIPGLWEKVKNTGLIGSDGMVFSPGKMEMLIELVLEDKSPRNTKEFYEGYLHYILDRERREKKETRVFLLEDMLVELANDLGSEEDGRSESAIRKLWKEAGAESRLQAQELLRLAIELPILEKKDGELRFKCKEYYEYYLEKG